MTLSQAASLATASAAAFRQVSISPAASAGPAADKRNDDQEKGAQHSRNAPAHEFWSPLATAVHCGKGPSAGQARPSLTPWDGAVLFTNSCGAGRNKSAAGPYLGVPRREPGRLRNAAPALNCLPTAPKRKPCPAANSAVFRSCAAAIGALAIAAFAAAPVARRGRCRDHPRRPPPTCRPAERHPDRGHRGRLLLGRPGRVPAHRGRGQRRVRLCRRQQGDRRLQHGLDGDHGARGSRSRSNTTRRRSATARSCRSSSRSCTTRPS